MRPRLHDNCYPALQQLSLFGILAFRVHERWLQKALAHTSTPALSGYNRPNIQQDFRADRAFWLDLADTQPGLTRSTANAPIAEASYSS